MWDWISSVFSPFYGGENSEDTTPATDGGNSTVVNNSTPNVADGELTFWEKLWYGDDGKFFFWETDASRRINPPWTEADYLKWGIIGVATYMVVSPTLREDVKKYKRRKKSKKRK